jgi:predicted TIM-barrel fold metal-dependent hydrolase
VAIAAEANDQLAEAIARHPDRFAGLASSAPHAPDRGVKEIRRAIEQLRLNGLIVNSHTQGEYLDDEKFWPIFEAAEALGAPIYIHPRNPPEAMRPALTSTVSLTGALCGFQLETSLHAMRLIVSGVFDRFPKLTVVLGHLGEGLPFFLYRMDWAYGLVKGSSPRPLQRRPSEYLRDNFVITTSGMNHAPVLQYCVSVLGAERIMFAVDYPFQDSKESADFIRSAPLSPADAEAISHRTAERVFRIAPR